MDQEERTKLAELIRNNPDLRVKAQVSVDVAPEDGYAWWLGEITGSRIDEYVQGRERVWLKSETSNPHFEKDLTYDDYEVLYDLYGESTIDDLTPSQVVQTFNALEWKPAIFVYVGVNEDERGS